MRKAIFIVMGAILAVGIAFAQTDPWWHPLNPQGASAGVTYGTQLPTLVNTGLQPTDGLLAVQITTGAPPNFQIYDQSTASWFSLTPGGGVALTDDTVPVWDTATNSFIDSGIVDDAADITITGGAGDIAITSAAGDDIILTTADVVTVAGGELLVVDGAVGAPALAFTSDADGTGTGIYSQGANQMAIALNGVQEFTFIDNQFNVTNPGGAAAPVYVIQADGDSGLYRIGANNYGMTMGGALVMDWAATNAAGAGADLVTISSTLGIMDGGDTFRGSIVDLASVDHTGVGNVIAAYIADPIAGDAQARETAFDIGTGYDVGISSTQHIFQRENFQQGFRKQLAADFTAATDGNGDVNIVLGTNGVNFEYREELAKGTSSFILDNAGSIDISADNTTVNEGVEFMLGSSQTTTSGYLIARTDQLCFSANITITLIAGTDQVSVGWRGNEAYEAANIYTNYADYNVVAVNNVDGSVFGLSDSTTGAAETDDSTTDWANGETKTLKACIDGAGLPHGYLDGVLIVETNRTTAIDADIMMVPFVTYMQAGGAVDAAVLINWWEITAN